MSESLFGPHSQHLLPSHPSANLNAGTPTTASPTAPVQPSSVAFKDFRFNSIGKQPELLSRISHSQPENVTYQSPTPSPSPTPPPVTNDIVFPSKLSRPTLFQKLGSQNVVEADRSATHASPNSSLAARILMDTKSPDNAFSGFPPPQSSRLDGVRTPAENTPMDSSNLIPPIEYLPTRPDSVAPTPSTPTSSLLEPVHPRSSEASSQLIGADNKRITGVPHPNSSSPIMNADTNVSTSAIVSRSVPSSISNSPPPLTVSAINSSRAFPGPSTSLPVTDAVMRDLPQLSSETIPASDSLGALQERLKATGARLAHLASPPPPPPPLLSTSPVSSTISRADANPSPILLNQSRQDPGRIVLRHPYPVDNRSSDRPNPSDSLIGTKGNVVALVTPSATLPHEYQYQTQRKVIMEAVHILNTALAAAYRSQSESEGALTARIQAFENERAAFEEKKQRDEAILQNQFREIQQKRDELTVKEASLIALEKENRAKELARRAVLEKRQALDEERRTADEKRRQEVQEQIITALQELQRLQTLRKERLFLEQRSDSMPNLQPLELQEGMSEEEVALVQSRNGLVFEIKHHSQMRTEKLQQIEESERTLQKLKAERKEREAAEAAEAAEAERHRVENQRIRALAKAELARRVMEQQRREREEAEAAKKHQEAEKVKARPSVGEEGHVTFGRARLLVEQQALAEAHGARQGESVPQDVEQGQQQGIVPSQQRNATESSSIRATRQENSLNLPKPSDAMGVDDVPRLGVPNCTVPSSNIHSTQGVSQKTSPKQKPISGGVMLSVPVKVDGAHLPTKPSMSPRTQGCSIVTTGNVRNVDETPSSPASPRLEESLTFPVQLASEFNQLAGGVEATNVDDSCPLTPDWKSIFSQTPRAQTILDGITDVDGNQPLNIGPRPGVSPTQRNVNLRHLKRSRGRVEENESGDRSARTSTVKSEDAVSPSLKKEENDDLSRELVQNAPPANPPSASLPPRPSVIPPSRPRRRSSKKRRGSQPASSQPSATSQPHEMPCIEGTSEVTSEARPENPPVQMNLHSQGASASAQLSVPPINSMLLAPLHSEAQSTTFNFRTNEKIAQERVGLPEISSLEPISATFPHETELGDPTRDHRRLSDESRPGRTGSSSRRQLDYHPSTVSSQSLSHHPGSDSWRPPMANDVPRAEPVRASPPTTGRKRPSDSNDAENLPRSRRQRSDVWIADEVRERRRDSNRRDGLALNSEREERRPSYRTPPPPDRSRSHLPERVMHDTNIPSSDVLPARYEQSYRRPENEESRHLPAPPHTTASYHPKVDQYRPGDTWVGTTYDPLVEGRMEVHQDPKLLARMSDTQRFPIAAHSRVRGRSDPSKGRADLAKGRGNGRGGTSLLGRLTSGPSSLEDRLT